MTNQEDLEKLKKQINQLPPEKKQSVYTQAVEQVIGEEIENLDLKINLGKQMLGLEIEPEEDLKIKAELSFKGETKAGFSISKKF